MRAAWSPFVGHTRPARSVFKTPALDNFVPIICNTFLIEKSFYFHCGVGNFENEVTKSVNFLTLFSLNILYEMYVISLLLLLLLYGCCVVVGVDFYDVFRAVLRRP
jgi:hypothetical protein